MNSMVFVDGEVLFVTAEVNVMSRGIGEVSPLSKRGRRYALDTTHCLDPNPTTEIRQAVRSFSIAYLLMIASDQSQQSMIVVEISVCLSGLQGKRHLSRSLLSTSSVLPSSKRSWAFLLSR